MAAAKQINPMPFPGESPTVALAMAAADKFGFHEEAKAASSKAKPKRRASSGKKKAAKPARRKAAAGARKTGRARRTA